MHRGRAQVALRDRDEALGDLHQRRGQRGRVAGQRDGAGVGGELAVARQRAGAERADPADRARRSRRRARAATSPGRPRARRRRAAPRPAPPTTVITAASRLATCASSCAITASSSRGSSRSSRPCGQVQPEAAARRCPRSSCWASRCGRARSSASAGRPRCTAARRSRAAPAPRRARAGARARRAATRSRHADPGAECRARPITTTDAEDLSTTARRHARPGRTAAASTDERRRSGRPRPSGRTSPEVGGEEVARRVLMPLQVCRVRVRRPRSAASDAPRRTRRESLDASLARHRTA